MPKRKRSTAAATAVTATTEPRDVWRNISPEEASGQSKSLTARRSPNTVYTEYLTLTPEQTSALEQAYSPDGKPQEDREFVADDEASQNDATALLTNLRLDIAHQARPQPWWSFWSVKWASRQNHKSSKSPEKTRRILFQCDSGYNHKVVGVKKRQNAWRNLHFTGCLAHVEATYIVATGTVLRVRGVFAHNDACRSAQRSVAHQSPAQPPSGPSVSLPLENPLPLPSDAPPPGFEHEHIEDYSSVDSNTAAFATNLDRRDVFLGQQACIVCGADIVERCHVIPPSERETWEDLQNRGYVPTTAKSASDELRNAITLCPNHHKRFDSYQAFIRFCPEVRKYVFVNYSETPSETAFHGKAVALESHHDHAPLPAVFLIHECRVRGFWPFRSPTVDILSPVPWQDWLLSREIIDSEENIRHEGRAGPVASTYVHAPGPTMPLPFPAFPACVDPVLHTIPPPTTDFVALVLAAAQSMPTWRACQIEGQSWEGVAEENITKYQHAVGSDQVERAQHGGLPFF